MTLTFHLLCLLLLQLLQVPLLISAQTYTNISLGSFRSTHNKNPYWSSPSGEFCFGFYPAPGGKSQFLLAIWFGQVPQEAIVWTANNGNTIEGGSKVQLTIEGGLSLTNTKGADIWKAATLGGAQVASAAVLDSGNLVLMGKDSTIIWESFRLPTDTLLPTQTLDLDGVLISRLTDDNFSPGRFKLYMQQDGDLALYPFARPAENTYRAYWDSKTVGTATSLVFNQSGYLYLTINDGSQVLYTTGVPVSTRDFYHRVTLDLDGAIRQYTYPKSSTGGQWSSAWSIPENVCLQVFGDVGTGVCGLNSYCKLEAQRATCQCPPGYVFKDSSNIFGGCKRNFVPQSCDDKGRLRAGEGYEMKELPSTDWAFGDYQMFNNFNEESCKQTCLEDCECAAAITRELGCWLKRSPLASGKLQPGLKGKALVKVGNSTSPNLFLPPNHLGGNKRGRDKLFIPGSVLLGTSALFNCILLLLISLFGGCSYRTKKIKARPDDSAFAMNLRSFTYKELEEATKGFKEELGKGTFSTVYKGSLPVTGHFIAVKKLQIVPEVEKEFKTEVRAIGRTNHKNLIQLLGFCDEGPNRLLVYEYIPYGSLENFLFGSSRLEWSLRIQIAFGIARGLTYLHEDCSTQIIHCDVKPQNILIDDSFIAKISDFGLAKLLMNDQTRTQTGIRGTRGYVAPEWFKNTAITAKVDVYSFGIMLLEIISCRRNAIVELGAEDIDILSDWAYQCCWERSFHLLVGNEEAATKDKRLEILVMVALWCIQIDPSLRPTMKKVTQMLEEVVAVSMPPDPSSLSS